MKSETFVTLRTLARLTLREALRQRFAAGLAVVALLLGASGLFLSGIDLGGAQARLLADTGLGAFVLFGSALAIVVPATSLFADLDQRTVMSILAHPVARWEYLLGKWLGVAALLGLFSLLLTLLIGLQLAWVAGTPGAVYVMSPLGVLVAGLITWLRLCVMAALALAIATYARTSLFTILAGGGAFVIGQLQYLARDSWQDLENGFLRLLAWAVAHILPNLQAFDLADLLIFRGPPEVSAAAVLGVLGYGVLYTAAYLGIAVLIFERREL
ncbi:MAG: ABC transporter permease subunit [Opitutales bacterium]